MNKIQSLRKIPYLKGQIAVLRIPVAGFHSSAIGFFYLELESLFPFSNC